MKHLRWVAMTLVLLAMTARAQPGGAELVRQADQALATYSDNREANAAKLQEARQTIDRAIQLAEVQALARAWFIRGDIYNELFSADRVRRQAPGQAKAPLRGDNDALVAFDSYQRGLRTSPPTSRASGDAVKAIGELQGHLINIGLEKFEAGEYAKAFLSLQASLQAHDLLKARGQASVIDDAVQHDELTHAAGIAAHQAGRYADAAKYFDALVRKGKATAAVHDALYQLLTRLGDEASAVKVLEAGRRAWPADTALIFSEINLYLRQGRLQELVVRLKQAIAKEPDNVQVYAALGTVYARLQEAALKNDPPAAAGYLAEASRYYQQALARNPGDAELHYGLGALHFAQGARLSQELNDIVGNDRADLDRRTRLWLELIATMDRALPHFQKAESLDANYINALVGLAEIYRTKNDPLAAEFKNRLQTVTGGGVLGVSYFKR